MSTKDETPQKELPNFQPSGRLATEGAMWRGIFLKWDEPEDAVKPNVKWRLYVFKGSELAEDPIPISTRPGFLFGRDKRIADIPIQHPSCSSQHAVLYYRKVTIIDQNGKRRFVIRPFLMDLKSVNGTFINGKKLDDYKYYEIKEKDVVTFGQSTRDYVFLTEDSVSAGNVTEKEDTYVEGHKETVEEERRERVQEGIRQDQQREDELKQKRIKEEDSPLLSKVRPDT
ncbi:putative Smad nuclear interacting protein 1 [Blattamonas nauphoetae]|uniref:Smad nuclear interacting protein 1 n=1 Tax=Blattamonas nauphoetae TaxID=2049346 RepID=A0ABQ9YCF9_9EUKA|nr:putative Smad nuclear interacting protein 1 [Blattamonas nauphoetae]